MSGSLVLRNGRFRDPESGSVVEGDLLVERGVIEEIGSVGATEAPALDLGGATVVPGFLDAHFHAFSTCMGGLELERRALSFVAINATRRLGAALARGFTTVRDVAGGDAGLAQALDQQLVAAPRYLYSGPALSQTGGHGDPRPADLDVCFHEGHMNEIVDGVDDLRRAVRRRFQQGAHVIKIMTSGGVVSPVDPIRIPQYSAEEIAAVVDEATRRGSYVAAHSYSSEAVIHSVTHGVRSIEHGNLIDSAAARTMAEHGAYLVPTLVAYDSMARRADEVGLSPVGRAKNAEVLGSGKDAITLATEAGVPVGFGSDLMGDLENDQLRGLQLQAEVQTPEALLRSLTTVNAALFRRPELGRLAVGSPADLVALAADPMDDVEVLWDESRPRTVVRAGVPVGLSA
ncbi:MULTISPECIES: metal-dependent hydrolase family protein [Mumia]|uniref:metal-dependent hydrolase family protein n=1 Tax=Mumia TaxID=1546255 RepID=UPI00142009C1|nr:MULTISPECIES: amidohydrolase family protein [unclassified Mumia]QMW65139.1 amidohydrolase family protein [Mumia sp. ZJ1417]